MMIIKLTKVAVLVMVAIMIFSNFVAHPTTNITNDKVSVKTASVNMNNKNFGTWNNPYEIKSYTALSQNIHKDTMLVLGSSEFNHGKDTPYHPKNFFKQQNVSLMTVGLIYNESLNQEITLGALSGKLHNKKVVFILSPTWFNQIGVPAKGYANKFSESEYMEFLMNKSIPKSTKVYVAARTERLLTGKKKLLKRVKKYDRIFIAGKGTTKDKLYFDYRRNYLAVTESNHVLNLLKKTDIKRLSKYNGKIENPKKINWKFEENQAITNAKVSISKQYFGMDTTAFNNKFGSTYTLYKNKSKALSFQTSPEYNDLESFLQVCKSEKIKTELILQPLNGSWYDYCGLTKAKRAGMEQKVALLGKKYDAKVVDFSGYDYKPYFLIDNVHPWDLGWLKIDKAIYSFYKS